MDFLLLLAALVGHTALWAALINRVHSSSFSYYVGKRLAQVGLVMLGSIPVVFGLWFVAADLAILGGSGGRPIPWPGRTYLVVCWVLAAMTLVWWLCRPLVHRDPKVVRSHRSERVGPLGLPASSPWERNGHHLLLRVPGNEVLHLDLSHRVLEVARLPAALDGLTIAHLSDFHFARHTRKAYFEEVVRLGNRFEADLVAVTGDVLEHSDFIEWSPDTLGKLEGRYGVYFVLGNHDTKADVPRLRRSLTELGLVDLGGRWVEIRIAGEPILLAGNELPWLKPAADLSDAPAGAAHGGPPRIALSHSPDQFGWARKNDFDLLLAGHTHGGQVRLPWIGPILTPSRTGVRYASGVFYTPPTVMHVTRGISGEHPIRLNCPPEITRLVLKKPEGRD